MRAVQSLLLRSRFCNSWEYRVEGISCHVMRTLQVVLAAAVCVVSLVAQDRLAEPTPVVIPDPAFTLQDPDFKPQAPPHTVLKVNKNSGSGPVTGTFAVYGGLPVEVSSLSFSGDGKLL